MSVQADPVRVAVVMLADVLQPVEASAPASVVARQAPLITSEVSAAVVEIPVEVGDLVTPGNVLARLDCRRLEAQLAASQASSNRAQSQRDFAKRQLSRARDLRKKKSISEELLDQRRTELAAAETDLLSSKAALELAAIDVKSCTIRSPLAAAITARHASQGDYLVPGSAVVALTELDGQQVSVALRNDQVDGFVSAATWAFESGGKQFPLSLRTVIPVVDTTARTLEARLQFIGEPASPGSPGRVRWSSGKLLVPADYLLRRDGKLGILTANGTQAMFTELVDAQEGRPAATSLPPETKLITSGRQRLSHGDAIEVVPARDGGE